MKEKVPNLVKEIDMQVQEAQRVPNKMDVKRPRKRVKGNGHKQSIICRVQNTGDKDAQRTY